MNYLEEELFVTLKNDPSIFNFFQEEVFDGMWYWDIEQPENEWMNSSFWNTLGYDPNDMPHKSDAWQDIIYQDDLKVALYNFNEHCKNPNHKYDQTVRYLHKKGHTVWIRCVGVAIRDEFGVPKRMLGVHTNITDLKLKEDILDKSNKASGVGYWSLNTTDKVLNWSQVTKEIHDVEPNFEPSLEKAIFFYKEGASRDLITKAVENAINNAEPWDLELELITANGSTKWVRAIGHANFHNGVCLRVFGTFQDISERVILQKKLLLSEQTFRGNFENAATGMAIVDTEGVWKVVNQKVCDMLGYTEEELYQMTFTDVTHPDDFHIDVEGLEALSDINIDKYTNTKRYIHKDGSVVDIIFAASTIRDINNVILSYFAQIVDITEMKAYEAKIENLLDITAKQNTRLKNFAYIVSHNLRSHSGNFEMLLDLFLVEYPEFEKQEMFSMLKLASANLKDTIENLNEVIQIKNTDPDALEVLNLNDYIIKAFDSLVSLAERKNVKLINEVPTEHNIMGVPAYLDSILLNFISNAIKYSRDNVNSILKITSKVNNKTIQISFEDNGLGIDLKKQKKKLFGMYKTFHGNEDSRGIGLFITKNQIENIGGKIEVISKVNEGSTFIVTLLRPVDGL